jgi:predicted MPP superfamily phosphohydrolase
MHREGPLTHLERSVHALTQAIDTWLGVFTPDESFRLHVVLLAMLGVSVIGGLSFGLLALALVRRRPLRGRLRRLVLAGATPLAIGLICLCDASLVEPNWLEVTHSSIESGRLPAAKHLRIVLVSDLHIDGWTHVLHELPAAVNAEKPDLIVFTGDALNELESAPIFREVMSGMHATYGMFGVRGNHDTSFRAPDDLFQGVMTELTGDSVETADGLVTLCGAPYLGKRALLACTERARPGFRIVAYHSPDLIRTVEPLGTDLYLAGHTHGGQFRLPFMGAVITMSAYGKAYEAGLYQVGRTALYVNRGIGESPLIFPIRFFCRPELTVLDVTGTGQNPVPAPPTVRVVPHSDGAVPLAPQ